MDIKEWIDSKFGDVVGERVFHFGRLIGGINSKVFYVVTGHGEYVVKHYINNKGDLRDRLTTEFGMLTFLWDNGIRNIRQPLFAIKKEEIGVYGYIKAKPFKQNDIQKSDILLVARFLISLHALSKKKKAALLPAASESAQSMRDYLDIIETRFGNLMRISKTSQYGKEISLILSKLVPLYRKIKDTVHNAYKEKKLSLTSTIASRTLSPSDIGFGNILKSTDGRLFFYDFEYGGWDDPAKTISDLYLHPAVSFPQRWRELFFKNVLVIADDKDMYNRLGLVYLIISIKWCIIMLNPFVKLPQVRVGKNKYEQFDKVKKRIVNLENDIKKRVFPLSLLKLKASL